MASFESLEPITNNFYLNVALGRYGGSIIPFRKYAKSLALKTTLTDIWTLDFSLHYPTEAETLYISSTSTLDTSVELLVIGIDAEGYYQEQQVTLTGTTPVEIPGLWLRTFRIRNTNGVINIGEVYISTSAVAGVPADIAIRCHMISGIEGLVGEPNVSGSTFMSHFTVPIGYVAIIKDFTTISPGSADISFVAYAREFGKVFVPYDQTGSTLSKMFDFLVFKERTDFKVMAKATSSLNRDVPVSYTMLLVKKEFYSENGTKIQDKLGLI